VSGVRGQENMYLSWTCSFSFSPVSGLSTSIVTRLLPFHPYVPVLKELGWREKEARNPGSAASGEAFSPASSVTGGGVWVMLMCSGWAWDLNVFALRLVLTRVNQGQVECSKRKGYLGTSFASCSSSARLGSFGRTRSGILRGSTLSSCIASTSFSPGMG
jgi:hypothetical protein